MESILQSLQMLGYTDKQARIYVALLSIGKGSIQSIAKQSEIKRPTVYVIIDELIEKGLVSRVIGSKKQLFIPTQPQTILDQTEKIYAEAKKCIPGLMSLLEKPNLKNIKTLYFEGIRGIEKALWYKIEELTNSEIVAFFGSTEFATEEMVKLFHKWNKSLKENHIKLKSVAPKNSSLKSFRKKDVEYGFQNKEINEKLYSSKISVDITKQFVRIIFFKEKQVLIIESVEFSNVLSEVFRLVWSTQG